MLDSDNKPSEQDDVSFDTLVGIIARLRGPGGCPWDRKQTHRSIRDSLLEETYEVLQALDSGLPDKLREELGDLLLQVVLHAQIASDAGDFDIGQVIGQINQKLVRRHPHVFGNAKVKDVDQVLINWEEIKKKERPERSSMLEGVPKALPSLAYSQSIQKRVARVGFDWDEDSGVIEKIAEEAKEITESIGQQEKESEYGDLLFALANLARRQGIDLESALRGANHRFYRRFSAMEQLCADRDLDFKKLSFDQQNSLWEEAKKLLKDQE
jgi:tetrapyrrole methylase family protein/MazG family protein